MIQRFLLICLIACIGTACNSGSTTEDANKPENDMTSLKKDVIAVHDTAMARMNHIGKLQKKLQQEITQADSVETVNAYEELQAAREAMMTWMREFDVPSEASEAEKMEYLKGEYVKINSVDEAMLKAINKAEKLLEHKAQN